MTDDPNTPRLSIVVPALNEAGSLETLLPALRSHFPDAEILIVDDGSSDQTLQVCQREQCRVVENPLT